MKKNKNSLFIAGIFAATLAFHSCKKEATPETNDEEVIATMKLTFTPVGGGTAQVFQFDDPDGPGGSAPTQDNIVLTAAKSYTVSVQLLNKTTSPVSDITTEVEAESEAHRFYYEPGSGSNIAVSGLDLDPNGIPVGINSVWTTGAAGNGQITVTLRHYPGNPPDKALNDPVNSTKSGTDITVTFNTSVN